MEGVSGFAQVLEVGKILFLARATFSVAPLMPIESEYISMETFNPSSMM